MGVHVRIDDRLLHGQVTHGWTGVLAPVQILIADDAAAGDDWEREAYEASGPEGVEVRVLTLGEAALLLRGGERATLLLVRGPIELLRLVERGVEIGEAVVGGLHAAPGRSAFRDDLQISPEEARAFVALTEHGVRCYYQPLPSDEPAELPDTSRLTGGEGGA